MTTRNRTERIRAIQRKLRLEPDGIIGNDTLSAIESALDVPGTQTASSVDRVGLTLTQSGVRAIVRYEISSEEFYLAKLQHPTWPGGDSGVTIGIGYDLGHTTVETMKKDWGDHLSETDLQSLATTVGKTGAKARRATRTVRNIKVPLRAARTVFQATSIPLYAKRALKAYTGLDALEPDAQSAIVSLVFNRGTSMANRDSRREMRELRGLIGTGDYTGMANSVRSMKRLWEGRGLNGLLKRRDEEADLIAQSQRTYEDQELVHV